jgi:tetratricopeptide (TPR) repeat protein
MEGTYPMMYYTHNFQFLSAAAATLGQSAKALEAAASAVKIVAPMAGHDPMVEYVLPWSLYALVRSEKWDEVLAYPKPAETTPVTLGFWHYARGLAYVGKADLAAARRSRTEFESARSRIPGNQMLNTNRAQDLHAIASSVLEGRLASAAGDTESALSLFRKAVETQDRLVYDEPPAWYYPVRESLGGEYLRGKKYADAEKIFRRDLEINPNNPRSLFGLSEALRGQSKNVEATEYRSRFETEWKGADVQVRVPTL